MYDHLAEVARQVCPERCVTGSGWRTSRTKILDSAVVAFWCIESGKIEAAPDDSPGGPANKISFDVPGPAKDGGTSILNVTHTHLPRVRALLEAARDACATQDFIPVGSGRVGLDRSRLRVGGHRAQSGSGERRGGVPRPAALIR
jgi:hypothetical protein